ncbi:MAG: hypothetical protein AAF993_17970 [Pseudomonadota bacterium]
MLLAYRGSVNRWECDENDHLNVRFYMQKHWQTLVAGLQTFAAVPAASLGSLSEGGLRVQQVRFLAECRIADPLSGYWSVVRGDNGALQVLTELRHSLSDQVRSSCVHQFESGLLDGLGDVEIQHVDGVVEDLPDHAGGRGVADEDLGYCDLALHQLADYGFKVIGMGCVSPEETLSSGCLAMHHYMGRLSDSMPHLWAGLGRSHAPLGQGQGDGDGGAVLEYRLRYHQPLRINQCFVVHSGLMESGAKLQRFAHLCFARDTGKLAVSAEAVGVRMDLLTRKARVMSDGEQARMRQQQLLPYA